MKEVNLKDILISKGVRVSKLEQEETILYSKIIQSMEQACKQVIDLCVQASREYVDNEDVKQSLLNVKTKIV